MKIAIVAMGASADNYYRTIERTGNRANMYDEVWTCNGFGHVFQHDRLFHMDDIRLQYMRGKNGNVKIGRLVEYLRTAKGPVYTSRTLTKSPPSEQLLAELEKVIAVLPQGEEREHRECELATLQAELELIAGGGFEGLVEFPLAEVINNFRCHPYFASTVAYMIALAAHEGHDMTIYGADFHYPDERVPLVERGRANCEWWIGQAIARGLNVDITRGSTLMSAIDDPGPYGYDGLTLTGGLDQHGNILIQRTERALPSAMEVERSYYKGPPQHFAQHMEDLRRG